MLWGKTPEEWTETAFTLEKTDITKAFEVMKKAKKEYPDNPDILSVYGYMAGLEAKDTYMLRAALLASSAISAFDDALDQDENHKNARMWRGILKINMPSFLGKVPGGIQDLEIIEKRDDLTEEDFIMTKFFLGMGYGKVEQYEKAIASFREVIALNKNDDYYKESVMRITRIQQEKE
jgi:tetratricopeptide (TPR) repeat protein